ncbi:hypothetical protein [Xenophilus azovorans]|uniref:hypothetical protein n=1 Tax=Xenophilus azovorans TaxID=151755 RepID=UPI00056E2BEB|nr:hypothetical protein [Xenophilus azovorans]
MANKYVQIMPADDWYFVHDRSDGSPVLYKLIGWALDEQGKVEGIVAVKGQDGAAVNAIPRVQGSRYCHVSRFSERERKALESFAQRG